MAGDAKGSIGGSSSSQIQELCWFSLHLRLPSNLVPTIALEVEERLEVDNSRSFSPRRLET